MPGKEIIGRCVPSGTLERFPEAVSTVPTGLAAFWRAIPGTEVPGYFQRSPRGPFAEADFRKDLKVSGPLIRVAAAVRRWIFQPQRGELTPAQGNALGILLLIVTP